MQAAKNRGSNNVGPMRVEARLSGSLRAKRGRERFGVHAGDRLLINHGKIMGAGVAGGGASSGQGSVVASDSFGG